MIKQSLTWALSSLFAAATEAEYKGNAIAWAFKKPTAGASSLLYQPSNDQAYGDNYDEDRQSPYQYGRRSGHGRGAGRAQRRKYSPISQAFKNGRNSGFGGYGRSTRAPAIAKVDYGLWESTLRLDQPNFYDTVMRDDDNVWVVAFINPTCPKCERFSKQWAQLQNYKSLSDRSVKFAYVDATISDNYYGIARKYTPYGNNGKKMYTPTLFVYGKYKEHPEEYNGSQFAFKLSEYLQIYCDNHGFGKRSKALNNSPTLYHVHQQLGYTHEKSQYNNGEAIDYHLWEQSLRLDHTTFVDSVINDRKNAWVVAFINPRCEKCTRFVPDWTRLQELDNMKSRNIKFGYVDVSIIQNKIGILQDYVGGKTSMPTPTVLIYGLDKDAPYQYRGNLALHTIGTWIKNLVDDEGFGKRNDFGSIQPDSAYAPSQYNYKYDYSPVNYGLWAKTLHLNRATYAEKILNDDQNAWVIAFMNPKCGECIKFAPHWDKLQTYESIRNRNVKFAFVDKTIDEDMAEIAQYMNGIEITYTPTVILYGRDKRQPIKFKGNYDSDTFNEIVSEFCDKNGYSGSQGRSSRGGYGSYGNRGNKQFGRQQGGYNRGTSGAQPHRRSYGGQQGNGGRGSYGAGGPSNRGTSGYGRRPSYANSYSNSPYSNRYQRTSASGSSYPRRPYSSFAKISDKLGEGPQKVTIPNIWSGRKSRTSGGSGKVSQRQKDAIRQSTLSFLARNDVIRKTGDQARRATRSKQTQYAGSGYGRYSKPTASYGQSSRGRSYYSAPSRYGYGQGSRRYH